MKQAILITAYQDLEFLSELLNYFDDDFDFYIHIDRKCKEDYRFLTRDKRVNIYNRYRIEWGGSNHIYAIVLLMQEASKKDTYGFYHLITGSDYPAKPLSVFKTFFEEHRHDNYMHYFKMPAPENHWGADGGMNRIHYFYFISNLMDIRKARHPLVMIDRKLRKWHVRFLTKRRFSFFSQFYGGSTYWSLSDKAVQYAVDYFKQNPAYLKRYRFTLIGEETFLQTVLMNNSAVTVQNNYLRYMRWDEWGTKPEILDMSDYENLQDKDVFFARKFDKIISAELLRKLKQKNQLL